MKIQYLHKYEIPSEFALIKDVLVCALDWLLRET